MKRFIFPLAICLCFLAHHTTVAAKDTWISVRTNNFFMVGNANEKDIKQVGLKLEQFREVFTRLFPNMKLKTPVPTTVMVFKNESSYAPFKIRANSSGHFQSGADVNYIALTPDTKFEDHLSVIFHEFTHLLVNNTFNKAPVWFNEGLAEYYSTFRITDERMVVLGFPIANHVILLRRNKLLPLRTLFEVDHKSAHYNEAEKTSIFYAQSWALMHYLMIGKAGRNEQLEKFMKLLNSRVPLEQAFQEAFGMTFEAMETDLTSYVGGDRYNVSLDRFASKLEFNITTEAKKLSEAEAQAYQGDLLLHSNRRKEAYVYLEQAVKLDPSLAMAHTSLGMAYFGDNRIGEAQASLARAVAANSQNYLAHYHYAFVLSRADAIAGLTIVNYSPELAAKIREHLQKAIALRPDFPESYNLLAYVSLVTGKDVDEAIVTLKRVLSEMPGQHNLAYMLAQLYFHKDQFKSARELVEEVVKSNAEEEVRRLSESLLKLIITTEEQRARYEAAKQVTPIVVDADNRRAKEVPFDPSQQLREALRPAATGETRLQGALVRIECEPKGGIVFIVKTANGLLRLRTPNFNNLEIKTWDAAVSGEITCGDRKPENGVVVCYLLNTDKRVKADGVLKSIEFVPSDFKLKPPA
jgi:tetratricopeptide (TPR) repeat protein